ALLVPPLASPLASAGTERSGTPFPLRRQNQVPYSLRSLVVTMPSGPQATRITLIWMSYSLPSLRSASPSIRCLFAQLHAGLWQCAQSQQLLLSRITSGSPSEDRTDLV